MKTSDQRIAWVTGANRGIGFEIARQLAEKGIFTLMGARSAEKGRAAADQLLSERLPVQWIEVDVADPASIHKAVRRVDNEFGRLDILVNNAGIARDNGGSVLDVPVEVFEMAFRTNTIGPLLLSRACVALMKRRAYGRIVNISSSMGSLTQMANAPEAEAALKTPSYRLSKTALNAVTVILAMELKGTPILVNSACPGWVRTQLGGEHAPLSPSEGADTPVWLATLPDDGPSGGFFRERKPIPW